MKLIEIARTIGKTDKQVKKLLNCTEYHMALYGAGIHCIARTQPLINVLMFRFVYFKAREGQTLEAYLLAKLDYLMARKKYLKLLSKLRLID